MKCDCKYIEPLFFEILEDYVAIDRDSLIELGNQCGYKRIGPGKWVKTEEEPVSYPQRDAALKRIGKYTVIKEHDDGDMTIDSSSQGKLIVTAEGNTFCSTIWRGA